VADFDDQHGPEVAAEIGGLFVKVNVADEHSVVAMYEKTAEVYGGIDVLFNNAGISPADDDSILTTGLDAWKRVQDVNLTSVYLCCKYAHPASAKARRRLDHKYGVLRRGPRIGDVTDLLHRVQGRRAGDES